MKRRTRPFFAGYLPWRPLLPAALVAAAGFSLQLTLLAGTASGAVMAAALAVAVGTLTAWGESRGADRARVELALQLRGQGGPATALGPRAPLLLLIALTFETLARALGEAALPVLTSREVGGPPGVEAVLLGALAFLATRVLARLWSLKRGVATQSTLADHGFVLPGAVLAVALAASAQQTNANEAWRLWPWILPAALALLVADFALVRRHGTDVFPVLPVADREA